MRNLKLQILLAIVLSLNSYAQNVPFKVQLEPITINNVIGLQAFAFGQANGKWLLIGGRLDGLHRRQPNFSFDVTGNNNQLIVIDPIIKQQWTASMNTLSTGLQEQLSSDRKSVV